MEINPIIKEVTTDCNLRCKYCFFAKQERKRERVNAETLKTIVSKICDVIRIIKKLYFIGMEGNPYLQELTFMSKQLSFSKGLKSQTKRSEMALRPMLLY